MSMGLADASGPQPPSLTLRAIIMKPAYNCLLAVTLIGWNSSAVQVEQADSEQRNSRNCPR